MEKNNVILFGFLCFALCEAFGVFNAILFKRNGNAKSNSRKHEGHVNMNMVIEIGYLHGGVIFLTTNTSLDIAGIRLDPFLS